MKLRFLFSAAVLLAGCATGGGSSRSASDHVYGADAKENYELGAKELKDKDWVEAERYLAFTSAKFPYSNYSALADLALADLDYQQEKYVEAIDKYKNFIKLHPTHIQDAYAAFQIGMANYEQISGDLFFLPSPAEKDQTDVLDALAAFNEFLIQYPSSDLRPKAQEKVADLRRRLADHEMRIGNFYGNHDRFRAAAGRYENILRDYPDTGFEGEAAVRLFHTYEKLGEPDKGKAAVEKFVKDHPDDPQLAQARKLVGRG